MKKNAITYVITLAAAGSIFTVAAYNGSHIARAKTPQEKPTTEVVEQAPQSNIEQTLKLQQVAVQTTSSASYQAEVIGYGETKPRYDLSFTSEVSGRVKSLAESFETGRIIKKGEVIAKLDDTSYQQAVSQAKADVASARLALLEEQRQGEQVKSEWERSGLDGEPSSPLVLRKPQLVSAQATLNNAQQALKKAEKDLEDTVIRAPFDALVVVRDIQPGSYLSTGSNIATLYSVDRVEVEIPLSDQQWANLPKTDDVGEWHITVQDTTSEHQWQARVARTSQHVTQDTRQRSLIAVVDYPLEQETPLYPGTFVQAKLTGTKIDQLWEVPASALSQQGDIWTVDAQGVLQKSSAHKLFERQDKVYVSPTLTDGSAQVVMRPLSNFQVGMKVTPKEEG